MEKENKARKRRRRNNGLRNNEMKIIQTYRNYRITDDTHNGVFVQRDNVPREADRATGDASPFEMFSYVVRRAIRTYSRPQQYNADGQTPIFACSLGTFSVDCCFSLLFGFHIEFLFDLIKIAVDSRTNSCRGPCVCAK